MVRSQPFYGYVFWYPIFCTFFQFLFFLFFFLYLFSTNRRNFNLSKFRYNLEFSILEIKLYLHFYLCVLTWQFGEMCDVSHAAVLFVNPRSGRKKLSHFGRESRFLEILRPLRSEIRTRIENGYSFERPPLQPSSFHPACGENRLYFFSVLRSRLGCCSPQWEIVYSLRILFRPHTHI